MQVRKLLFRGPLAAFGAALFACIAPAGAVIKVDLPVSKIVDTSQAVVVGRIERVSAEQRLLEVAVQQTLKGELAAARLRVQIVAPAELIKQAAAGQPLVLFVGKARGGAVAVLHLADTWVLANLAPGSEPPVWRVVQLHDAKQSFPGRTVALVRLLAELKAGRSTILDKLDLSFLSEVRKIARLEVSRPAWMLAADVNGDKRPDLLIGTGVGPRLLLAKGDGYRDVTEQWAKWNSAGAYRAFGDVHKDGKAGDLLLDNTLWVNPGSHFLLTQPRFVLAEKARPLAAALVDVNGDGHVDAVFLAANGELRSFESPGSPTADWRFTGAKMLWFEAEPPVAAEFGDWGETGKPHLLAVRPSGITRYALDADGGPPADFARLTGIELRKSPEKYREGLKHPRAIALDVNGDGRRDLFVLCQTGGLMLINRGFGAFLVDFDAGGAFTAAGPGKVPFAMTAASVWAAADLAGTGRQDLLILTEDGQLYAVASKPAQAAK